jgi:hypothetical protein
MRKGRRLSWECPEGPPASRSAITCANLSRPSCWKWSRSGARATASSASSALLGQFRDQSRGSRKLGATPERGHRFDVGSLVTLAARAIRDLTVLWGWADQADKRATTMALEFEVRFASRKHTMRRAA